MVNFIGGSAGARYLNRDNQQFEEPKNFDEFCGALSHRFDGDVFWKRQASVLCLGLAGEIFSVAGFSSARFLGLGAKATSLLSIGVDEAGTSLITGRNRGGDNYAANVGLDFLEGSLVRTLMIQSLKCFAAPASLRGKVAHAIFTGGIMMAGTLTARFATHLLFNAGPDPVAGRTGWGLGLEFFDVMLMMGQGKLRNKIYDTQNRGMKWAADNVEWGGIAKHLVLEQEMVPAMAGGMMMKGWAHSFLTPTGRALSHLGNCQGHLSRLDGELQMVIDRHQRDLQQMVGADSAATKSPNVVCIETLQQYVKGLYRTTTEIRGQVTEAIDREVSYVEQLLPLARASGEALVALGQYGHSLGQKIQGEPDRSWTERSLQERLVPLAQTVEAAHQIVMVSRTTPERKWWQAATETVEAIRDKVEASLHQNRTAQKSVLNKAVGQGESLRQQIASIAKEHAAVAKAMGVLRTKLPRIENTTNRFQPVNEAIDWAEKALNKAATGGTNSPALQATAHVCERLALALTRYRELPAEVLIHKQDEIRTLLNHAVDTIQRVGIEDASVAATIGELRRRVESWHAEEGEIGPIARRIVAQKTEIEATPKHAADSLRAISNSLLTALQDLENVARASISHTKPTRRQTIRFAEAVSEGLREIHAAVMKASPAAIDKDFVNIEEGIGGELALLQRAVDDLECSFRVGRDVDKETVAAARDKIKAAKDQLIALIGRAVASIPPATQHALRSGLSRAEAEDVHATVENIFQYHGAHLENGMWTTGSTGVRFPATQVGFHYLLSRIVSEAHNFHWDPHKSTYVVLAGKIQPAQGAPVEMSLTLDRKESTAFKVDPDNYVRGRLADLQIPTTVTPSDEYVFRPKVAQLPTFVEVTGLLKKSRGLASPADGIEFLHTTELPATPAELNRICEAVGRHMTRGRFYYLGQSVVVRLGPKQEYHLVAQREETGISFLLHKTDPTAPPFSAGNPMNDLLNADLDIGSPMADTVRRAAFVAHQTAVRTVTKLAPRITHGMQAAEVRFEHKQEDWTLPHDGSNPLWNIMPRRLAGALRQRFGNKTIEGTITAKTSDFSTLTIYVRKERSDPDAPILIEVTSDHPMDRGFPLQVQLLPHEEWLPRRFDPIAHWTGPPSGHQLPPRPVVKSAPALATAPREHTSSGCETTSNQRLPDNVF